MSSKIIGIDKELQHYRSQLGTLLVNISELVVETQNPDLIKTVDGLKYSIDKPFMFVVIGEVKAGKSSFVNALLESEVCATDVRPCTDKIQVINYSEPASNFDINEHLVEIGKPIEILKEISIVDTPGTNSVIKDHQLITEEFIPNSDLVFFVLFAKNPYFASTWDFLDYVSSEWLRKVVFILQQSDLLRSPELLEDNISEVKRLAENKGVKDPTIFATSAELEWSGDLDGSGFAAVRHYIRDLVTSKETYKIKLKNVTNTVRVIVSELKGDIKALEERLRADKKVVELVKSRFKRGREQSANEVELTVNRVAERYESLSAAIKEEFKEELSFFTVVKRTVTRSLKQKLEGFSERCKAKLKGEIEEISQERAAHILDGIRQFGEDLKLDLDQMSTHPVKSEKFQIKVLERRQDLLENVKRKVEKVLSSEGLVESLDAGAEGAVLGTGGAFAVIAIVIAQVVELVIAQFALLAVEAAFAGIGIVVFVAGFAWQRHRIIQKFEKALDDGKNDLKRDMAQRLSEKLSIIYDDLERECSRLYADVEREEEEIAPLVALYATIQDKFEQLSAQASQLLS